MLDPTGSWIKKLQNKVESSLDGDLIVIERRELRSLIDSFNQTKQTQKRANILAAINEFKEILKATENKLVAEFRRKD